MAARLGLTWVGHSTVLVEAAGARVLTDPALGQRVGVLRRVAPEPSAAVTDRVDAVLISHLHSDHVDLPSLRQIGSDVAIVAPPAAAEWLRARGFTAVSDAPAGASLDVAGLPVEAVPALHDGRRWPFGPDAAAVGFLIGGERPVYFAGDTDLFPEMHALAGRVAVALLPVWGWGPALGPGHLDPERAARAAALIGPEVAIPIHWGTLAPPWGRPQADELSRPAREFAAAAARVAPAVEVRVLRPGERTWLG